MKPYRRPGAKDATNYYKFILDHRVYKTHDQPMPFLSCVALELYAQWRDRSQQCETLQTD